MPANKDNQVVLFGLAVTVAALVGSYYVLTLSKRDAERKKKGTGGCSRKTCTTRDDHNAVWKPIVPLTHGSAATPAAKTASSGIGSELTEKETHASIEALDRLGKTLFKEKKFFEAAQAFTEALDAVEAQGAGFSDPTNPLYRQMITLMNNRSAMYEKGNFQELALDDCDTILSLDSKHSKARMRKLRVLEAQENYAAALVEVCAIQLQFMQQNRDNLRLGLPTPPPQVPQSKVEELLTKLVPTEVEKNLLRLRNVPKANRPLPSSYTILQLLKSYSGFNSWMAKVAKRGSMVKIKAHLADTEGSVEDELKAKRASTLLRIGERLVYDGSYGASKTVFEDAYSLVGDESVQEAMSDDDYARILEWTGMVRHWGYDLEGSLECFSRCAEVEPLNAEVLVKQACVEMDGARFDNALKLFDEALKIDPSAADALLHRANLRMLQQLTEEAKKDLQKCVEVRPDHVLARLRLGSILTAMNDVTGAKYQLELAERLDPISSEVQSYRGEIAFAGGELEEAKAYFKKAMELAPNNPTPYVNAALTVLNNPQAHGGRPDTDEVIRLLEKAIEVDPQFYAAYVQLGQLKLGTALTLTAAEEVVELYDTGLKYCRNAEELKDLCGMRILTVAQVKAASQLKMDTFKMQ